MPRPKRIRKIINPPSVKGFKPFGPNLPENNAEPVFLLYEEYEAIRLCDYEMLNHQEASAIMEISRPTLTRIYARARQKLAEAFVKGRQIVFEGGKVYFDSDWYICNQCSCLFNNPEKTEVIDRCPLCGSEDFSNYTEVAANPYGNSRCCEVCICPRCGFEREHQIGIPCNKLICPECNVPLKKKE
ncbi:MAG TPA: DUF134 domain-containing protein [Bacteroidales bacterium]|nr:DUF134 domain-containing protein [Bacteroidales bacterium]